MNVLLIGTGGREHALAWKIAGSKKLSKLFIMKGNAGTSNIGENIDIDPSDKNAVIEFIVKNTIGMVIIGPEDPLVNGLHDAIASNPGTKSVPVIGPGAKGAMLEGSKEFAKSFMARHHIPTAQYRSFTSDNIEEGFHFLEKLTPPYVLKADGLAAGKGVLIIQDLVEAKEELQSMLDGKFGQASNKVVIEEYLEGIELSVFVLTDGENYLNLGSAKDYKRIGEADTGLNTGGMGAVTPVPFADERFMKKVEEQIIEPSIKGLKKDDIPYQGFIFFGLMNKNGNPRVIEYNVRMGDPETQVVIPRIKNDILDIFIATANHQLDQIELELENETFVTVVLVSGGYPGSYPKGKVIKNIDQVNDSIVFHAGTTLVNEEIVTSGGRVLAITSRGKTMAEALKKSYKNAKTIDFEGKYYREDIGFDLK